MDRKVQCEQKTGKDDLGRYLRSCSIATDWPGSRIVYASRAAAVLGTYFSLIPVNEGWAPLASVIINVSVGSLFNGPRGSLRTFRVSPPVLVIVATIWRCSIESTACAPEEKMNIRFIDETGNLPLSLMESDRVAEAEATRAVRATKAARTDFEDMF